MRPGATHCGMLAAGFRYDTTWGFPDRNGFRLGVADVIPAWDAIAERVIGLDEVPLCWMDRTLSKYAGIEDPRAWVAEGEALAQVCRQVEGLWVGLWHPNLTPALGFPDAPGAFHTLLDRLVAQQPFIGTLSAVVAWRATRRSIRVLRRHQKPCLPIHDDVRDAAQIAADHRHPIAHRLEQYDSQSLGVAPRVHDGGQDEHAGSGIGAAQLLFGDPPPHLHQMLQTTRPNLRLEPGPLRSVADDDELGVKLCRQERQRVDQITHSLALDQASDEEDQEAVARPRERGTGSGLGEADGVGNHAHAHRNHVGNLARSGRRDRNYLVMCPQCPDTVTHQHVHGPV